MNVSTAYPRPDVFEHCEHYPGTKLPLSLAIATHSPVEHRVSRDVDYGIWPSVKHLLTCWARQSPTHGPMILPSWQLQLVTSCGKNCLKNIIPTATAADLIGSLKSNCDDFVSSLYALACIPDKINWIPGCQSPGCNLNFDFPIHAYWAKHKESHPRIRMSINDHLHLSQ